MAPLQYLLMVAAMCFGMSHCSAVAPDWRALNGSVNGRLLPLLPLAFPCYTKYNGKAKTPDKEACSTINSKKRNTEYLSGQAGGLILANWGVCQSINAGCPISLTSSGIIDANCAQGSVADYYIDVQRPSNVQEALKFANQHGIQVVVKNTGHDYIGRSTAPRALSLWTHNYQPPITLTRQFTPEGCSAAVGTVITFGAGQQFDGIYKFADANNVTVVGGDGGTVGAAGWMSGGGHGMLSPVFGLGVDNVQQFKVVLPNGTFVTANRCKNPEIFFALRGGGGGTFGVVMEMTTTAHPQQTLQYALFQLGNLNQDQKRDFLRVLVANANQWLTDGWGGDSYPVTRSSIELVNPLLDTKAATSSLQPLIDFVKSIPKASYSISTYNSWDSLFTAKVGSQYTNYGSYGTAMSSRLIPAANFEGKQNQEKLVDAIMAGALPGIYPMLCMSPPARTADDGTALTPAWRRSTWHFMFITQWDPSNTDAKKIQAAYDLVHKLMDPLRKLTPSAGVYINEADVLEENTPALFWGPENYQKLLKIKAQLDPNNVLQVHGGVGSDPKAQMFQCYPKGANAATGSYVMDEL